MHEGSKLINWIVDCIKKYSKTISIEFVKKKIIKLMKLYKYAIDAHRKKYFFYFFLIFFKDYYAVRQISIF